MKKSVHLYIVPVQQQRIAAKLLFLTKEKTGSGKEEKGFTFIISAAGFITLVGVIAIKKATMRHQKIAFICVRELFLEVR